MKRYVIIGNSTAAVGCIEGIRRVDREGRVTVISSEPHHTYSRPLISYLLCGKTDRERMKYRGDDFYEKNGVDCLLGRRAERVDAEAHAVILDGGERVSYDRLLIAAGSRPFVPPFAGLDTVERKFTFQSLDDADALAAALRPDSRVLIVGAGLIGLKCAEGICERVGSITVADLAPQILPSILDADSARIVQEHIEAYGVAFRLGDSVERFEGGEAVLQSGARVGFDVLVLAVGVRPNAELAAQAGCEVGRGIVTDERCAATVPDIYAAGDCAESFDVTTGQRKVLALLPNAYKMGECAGINMAGGDCRYDAAMPMNAVGFFGLHLVTAGAMPEGARIDRTPDGRKTLAVKDGVLKGFQLIGDVRGAGIYTALIRERTPLDSIDYQLIFERPQLMAFAADARREMLA